MSGPSSPILVDNSGYMRTSRVLVSMHRGPLTMNALAICEDMQRSYGGTFVDFEVHRIAHVRPTMFADQQVRRRIVELGSSTRIERGLVVFDGGGLANAGVRIAFAGVLMLLPRQVFDSYASLQDAWPRLALLIDDDGMREARAAVDVLTAQLWPGTSTTSTTSTKA